MCETIHVIKKNKLYDKVPCWQIDQLHVEPLLPPRARTARRDGRNQSLMLFLQNSIVSKKSSVRVGVVRLSTKRRTTKTIKKG